MDGVGTIYIRMYISLALALLCWRWGTFGYFGLISCILYAGFGFVATLGGNGSESFRRVWWKHECYRFMAAVVQISHVGFYKLHNVMQTPGRPCYQDRYVFKQEM